MMDPVSGAKLAPLVEKFSGSLVEATKGLVTKKKDELLIRFKVGFKRYISEQAKRYSNVKTIIGSNRPLEFADLYVNLYLSRGSERIRDEDFLEIVRLSKRIVFTGTAGAGKSMLMRFLFFSFLGGQTERLPVFLELRDINDSPATSIMEFIHGKIQAHIDGFTVDQLRYALREGMLVLFLDGYDEIDHDRRKHMAREINLLAGTFDKNIILVSSRPDESFIGWQRFSIYQTENFTEQQVRRLIDKIPYDDDIKALFVKKLDNGLYETHREFLVNPLLTLMMLITLEQVAEIPAKIHLFYEYAFEALFFRHDVSKGGGFQRKRRVDLALDDYRRLFSYFCTISYTRESFRFTESGALSLLSQSISSAQIHVMKQDMLADLVECTCMLSKEGLEYIFSHRSFQEYFVAYFFARIKSEEFERVAPRLIIRGTTDNVFLMMSEMNKEKFEESWALPQLDHICELTKEIDPLTDPFGYTKTMSGGGDVEFVFVNDDLVTISSTSDITCIRYTFQRIYNEFEIAWKPVPGHKTDRDLFLTSLKSGKVHDAQKRFGQYSDVEMQDDSTLRMRSFTPTKEDNGWLKETHFAQASSREKFEFTRLRNEVSRRVEQRKAGLASILGF